MDDVVSIETALAQEYEPTTQQRRIKAKLLTLVQDNPLFSLEDLTLDKAMQITKARQLKLWWNKPGFQEWFCNRNEFRALVMEGADVAVMRMINILQLDDPRYAGAQVNAAKLLFEAANKMPAKQKEVKYSDESINKMDPLQLEDFLRKAGYVRLEEVAPANQPQLLRESGYEEGNSKESENT